MRGSKDDKSAEVSENEYLKNLIDRCRKNDKDAQKEMSERLRQTIYPVEYSLKATAEKCGLNKEDID